MTSMNLETLRTMATDSSLEIWESESAHYVCRHCETRGVTPDAYGPEADPGCGQCGNRDPETVTFSPAGKKWFYLDLANSEVLRGPFDTELEALSAAFSDEQFRVGQVRIAIETQSPLMGAVAAIEIFRSLDPDSAEAFLKTLKAEAED